MQRRVLHLVNGDLYAGAERVQHLLADALPDLGYQVVFGCLKPGLFPTRLEPHIEHHAFYMRGRLDLVDAVGRAARYVRRNGIDLIHTHTTRSALVGCLLAARTRLPLVHHVHSPASRETARRFRDTSSSLIERLALYRADALVAVSNSLHAYLLSRGHRASRIVTIPNGVPSTPAVAAPTCPPLTLGLVALFRPRKGIEVLLRAMARLVAQGHDLRLVAVGAFESDPYQKQVMHVVQTLGLADRIDWRGYRVNVQCELANMHVLVQPSLFAEGMPMAILEAMAACRPIIASRLEGIPEVVRDRRDGLLVAPGNEEALTEAIHRAVTGGFDLAAAGASAQQRQRAGFTHRLMARRVSHVYDVVLGNPRGAALAAIPP